MAAPLSSSSAHGPWGFPESLADLRGPTEGAVTLPLRLAWSGARGYDVADLSERLALYQIVITEGQRADIEAYLHEKYLAAVWPKLRRLLGPRYRNPWEARFPMLLEAAQDAEPALREELRRAREELRRELSD